MQKTGNIWCIANNMPNCFTKKSLQCQSQKNDSYIVFVIRVTLLFARVTRVLILIHYLYICISVDSPVYGIFISIEAAHGDRDSA